MVAPDLYGGKVAATIAEAKKLRAETTASRKEKLGLTGGARGGRR